MKLTREVDISGRFVKVFDDVFDAPRRFHMYRFMINSLYKVDRLPFDVPERSSFHKTLKCEFSVKDMLALEFFNNDGIVKYLKDNDLRIYRCYTNLCTASDIYQYHVDVDVKGCPTGLYYANLDWNPEWEGETHFSDDDMKDILFSTAFIPGRLVLFDGTIPHKSSQPAPSAPYYRFVLAIKFVNKNCMEWNESTNIDHFIYRTDYDLSDREKACLEFIKSKAEHVPHSGTTFYTHLSNTFYILKSLGQSEEVCLAGLFHAIFGTEFFNFQSSIDRQEVIDLIGEYATSLVDQFAAPNRDYSILENIYNNDPKVNLDLLYMLYANCIEQVYRIETDPAIFNNIRNKIATYK